MKAINDGLNSFLTGLSGTNAALLGALLAAMMAADLGGPINKAAYVFGTATLATTVAEGGSVVMASVMAGGMVPPLAIFIATVLFKNKFTKDQKEAGLTNIVMGLSFVTEGAIPLQQLILFGPFKFRDWFCFNWCPSRCIQYSIDGSSRWDLCGPFTIKTIIIPIVHINWCDCFRNHLRFVKK